MNVFEIVTERVIKSLESGKIPWQKPWTQASGGIACNLVSGKPYRGINVWLLASAGYSSPYWLSLKQVLALKGRVKADEFKKSSLITFWKRLEKSSTAKVSGLKASDREYSWMLRYYMVYNVEQCTGLEKHLPKVEARAEFNPIVAAEAALQTACANGLPNPIECGDRACYHPTFDTINVPARTAFVTPEAFYATCFHELGHATGHSSRIDRDLNKGSGFGSHEYSKEELIAEMTSAFLCAECGIEKTFDNTVAYIQSWIGKLKDDPRMVVYAASAAQKAVEYMKAGKPVDEEDDEG